LHDTLLFEHPLNERTRTLLRLARLFDQFQRHIPEKSAWSHRVAVQALVDILAILSRADIKSELIKQLDQHAKSLQKVALNPEVDQARLQRVLADLERTGNRLHGVNGQLGAGLRKNEFLNSIAQRLTIPGGSFEFDLPQFHYWLNLPPPERVQQLEKWQREIAVVQDSVELLLGLLRHSSLPRQQVAPRGTFQKGLDPQRPVEMIQVAVDPALKVHPEISGSKHRLYIRFLENPDGEHAVATEQDVPFSLKICVL